MIPLAGIFRSGRSFALAALHPLEAKQYEDALIPETGRGIDIVIDYPWGRSAEFVIVAVAKAVEDGRSMRFGMWARQAVRRISSFPTPRDAPPRSKLCGRFGVHRV